MKIRENYYLLISIAVIITSLFLSVVYVPMSLGQVNQKRTNPSFEDPDYSIEYLLKRKQAQPYNPYIDQRIGWTYYRMKKYSIAIKYFTASNNLKVLPENYEGLGLCFFKLGDYDNALVNYKKYLEIEPKNAHIYRKLGWTYYNLRKYNEAISQFKISIDLEESIEAYHGLGLTYCELQDYKNADDSLSAAFSITKGSYYEKEIKFAIAECYSKQGNYQGAYDILGKTPYLGIEIIQVENGFKIHKVRKGSPASIAGLKSGDIVTSFDGKDLKNVTANIFVKEMVRKSSFGTKVNVIVERGGQHLSKYVSIGITPSMAKTESVQIKMEELTKRDIVKSEIRSLEIIGIEISQVEDGLKIHKVRKGSPASIAGLKPGDILTNLYFAGEFGNVFGPHNVDLRISSIKEFIRYIESMHVPSMHGYTEKIKRPYSLRVKRKGQYLPKTVALTPSMAEAEPIPKKMEDSPKKHFIRSGVSWAVIIGISNYKDTRIPTLRYSSKDAKSFYNWAISPKGGKYPPSQVKLLLNNEATGRKIKDALYIWLKQALEEDMVVIYFAGHGSPESPDSPDNLYFLPYDTDYKNIASTGFPMWDIETALKRFIKAKKVVVIADACHAGGVGQPFDVARRANKVFDDNSISYGFQNLSQIGDGICVISASDDKQFSQESKRWGGGHGVFTYFLLEGLKGKADYNRDTFITLGELIPYLSEQVRRATKNAQSPTVAGKFDPALSIGR